MNAVLNSQLAPLRARWSSLEPRQRVVIAAAGSILALGLLIAYVWLPLERNRAALQKRMPELRLQLTAMERDEEEVRRLRKLSAVPNATAPRALDAAQLRANFAGAQVTALDGSRFRVVIADTGYAQWIDELRRLGATAIVDEATLVTTSRGRVSVDAIVGPPGRKTP